VHAFQLTGWPSLVPISWVSEDMWTFLQSSPTPTLFVVPTASFPSEEGLSVGSLFLSHEEIFVAICDGRTVAAFRKVSKEIDGFMLSWTRWADLSGKSLARKASQSLLATHLRNLFESQPIPLKVWSHTREDTSVFQVPAGSDGVAEFIQRIEKSALPTTKDAASKSSSSANAPTGFLNITSSAASTKEFLDLLHAPALSKNSHLIPELSQALTQEVPATIRNTEFKARGQLDALVSASAVNLLISQILADSPEIPADWQRFRAQLLRMGSILEVAVSLLSPLTLLLATQASELRGQARSAATKDISDVDIKSKLKEGVFSSSLFCPSSVSAVQEAVQRPAPRLVGLASASKTTQGKPYPYSFLNQGKFKPGSALPYSRDGYPWSRPGKLPFRSAYRPFRSSARGAVRPIPRALPVPESGAAQGTPGREFAPSAYGSSAAYTTPATYFAPRADSARSTYSSQPAYAASTARQVPYTYRSSVGSPYAPRTSPGSRAAYPRAYPTSRRGYSPGRRTASPRRPGSRS
jgi:hypothetical protein